MADIRPFRAYRPAPGLEREIAALPYDVYSREEAAEVVKKNPKSFLGIDRAECWFSPDADMYGPQVYEKARELLWQEIGEGWFVREDEPRYYVYQQEMKGRKQTGITACASIDDYLNDVIKKHENTRADKEADRIRHVDVCDAQTGPIFLAYRSHGGLREIMERTMEEKPLYDFVSEDGVGHRVWIIRREETERVRAFFGELGAVYIADGHHRCASAVKVGLKRREEHPGYTGEEEFNYFLAVLFPEDELAILDYNRVVMDLNGLTKEEFLAQVEENFLVKEADKVPYKPEKKGEFGMYLDGTWYVLTAKEAICSRDAVDGLDVSILQNYLLGPILGIQDPKTDKRIDFVGGIRGLKELERRVGGLQRAQAAVVAPGAGEVSGVSRISDGMKVAFSLYPTSIQELFAVADVGRLMPPKSTWFEPKLRSGLFLHSLRD